MNQKFLSALLFGALACTTATFVACDDYDDDIDSLDARLTTVESQVKSLESAISSGKWVASYSSTTNGYNLVLSDGSILTITNGKDGATGAKGDKGDQGEQGIQGIQGIQGEKGEAGTSAAAIIPQFRVDAEGYWEVSVDEGATYTSVLDVNGAKVKATGEKGEKGDQGEKGETGATGATGATGENAANAVVVGDDGYLYFGETQSTLKFDQSLPSIIANEENQTLQITIDGNTYVLPLESSTYKGLQSIIWRPESYRDQYDYAKYVAIVDNDVNTLISGSAELKFKVLPATFDVEKASYNFVDFHKLRATRADAEPTLTYVPGSAKLKDGILTLNAVPSNTENLAYYGSTLEVTVNGDVASSDYFKIRNYIYFISDLTLYTVEADEEGNRKTVDEVRDSFTFVYTDSLDLKEELALGIYEELLSEMNIPEDQIPALSYAFTAKKDNGLFQLSEDGVVTVKDVTQSSAINEYAYVTITYTEPTADGKGKKVTEDLTIQAVRADEKVEPTTIKLLPDDKNSVAITYTGDAQVVTLKVRDFEEKIGGRDYINSDNNVANSKIYQLAYLDKDNKLVAIGNAPTADVSAGPEAKDVTIGDNDIALYFKAGTDTSKDGLYLLIGKTFNALPDATTLYAIEGTELADVVTNVNVSIDGVQVTRTFSATLKSEYSKRTIIGVLSNGTTYTLQSEKFDEMYEKTPKDAVLEFALNKDQSEVVAKLIKDGKLTFTGNVIKLDPVVDLTTPLTVKVDVIDATDAANKKTYKTEEWTIKSPVSYTGSVSGKFTVKDPTLATNDKISILGNKDLKPAWKSVVVTGVNNEKILTFTEGSTYNFTKAYDSYTTVETKGLQFEISKDEKDFSIDAKTGTLTWLEEPTGSVYEHTVTVTVKLYHDWGTITLGSYTVEVSREK
jgi:hypothetical protein